MCSGLTGLLFSGVITVLVSLASTSREMTKHDKSANDDSDVVEPDNYDFSGTRAIATYDDESFIEDSKVPVSEENGSTPSIEDKKDIEVAVALTGVDRTSPKEDKMPADRAVLQAVFRRAAWYSFALALIVTIIGELSTLARDTAADRSCISTAAHVLLALRIQRAVLYVLGRLHDVSSS